jgi:hypothetical protein
MSVFGIKPAHRQLLKSELEKHHSWNFFRFWHYSIK